MSFWMTFLTSYRLQKLQTRDALINRLPAWRGSCIHEVKKFDGLPEDATRDTHNESQIANQLRKITLLLTFATNSELK